MATARKPELQVAQENPNPRLFTVKEAGRTLPLVRKIVADVVRTWHQYNDPVQTQAETPQAEESRKKAQLRLEKLLGELVEIGCLLKDWRLGLIDFMALYQGRQVELCWKQGEDTVACWHEVGAGFPGRQPITPEFAAQVEREVTAAHQADAPSSSIA